MTHFFHVFYTLMAVSLLLLSLCDAASYPNPKSLTGAEYIHDPTIAQRGTDGKYFLMATHEGIWIRTSTNLVDFTEVGVAFANGSANWTDKYTGTSNGNLWAPDLTWVNNKFYLYYCASKFGSSKSAIFLATSTTGEQGSWTHQGLVLESNSSSNFNAIDPSLIIVNNSWYLSFGSFWSGIKLVALDSSTGKPKSGATYTSLATRTTNSGAVEASQIYQHGNYFYLFVSFDNCCKGANSTYHVVVGRSTTINGSYADRNGTLMTKGGGTTILSNHSSIHGPGGQFVYKNDSSILLVYHYYQDNGNSKLGINTLSWDSDGWPYVA